MAKANSFLFKVCCTIFLVTFYSTSQFKLRLLTCPREAVKLGAEASQQDLVEELRTKGELAQTTLHASSHSSSSASRQQRPSVTTDYSAQSKTREVALQLAIELQYALNNTDVQLEDPHLFSMGRYVNSLTTYLEAMLSTPSMDRGLFHSLRLQLFPWWFPSTDLAFLPWATQDVSKTGIVLTVGKGNFVLASHCVRVLGNVVHSALPIQVFYAGDNDLPKFYRDQLLSLHPLLETVDILDHQFNETTAGLRTSGWAMKPFAALASSFRRVILIDADTIFLQRPDGFFDGDVGLNRTGLYYFHDRAYHGQETTGWIKTLMQGSSPSTTLNQSLYWQHNLQHQQESGVVFINKAIPSAFMSLLFTVYINTQKVRQDVYSHIGGKQPVLLLLLLLLRVPRSGRKSMTGYMLIRDFHRRRQGNLLARLRAQLCPLHLCTELRRRHRQLRRVR